MRSKSLLLLAFVSCGGLPAACGRAPSSAPKGIATDLPDDGTNLPVHLYWITDHTIFRGTCDGRRPLLRANCGGELRTMDYDQFKTQLDNGLSDTIRDLSREAVRIQSAIEVVEGEIRATLAEIAEIERRTGPLSAELEQLRRDMLRFESFVQEYREQLNLIDASLRRIADHDLATQRELILQELSDYQARLVEIANRIPALLDQVNAARAQIDVLKSRLDSLGTRLTNLRDELGTVSARLKTAYDDFSVYEDTVAKLTDGIIYHVLSDNVLYQKNRQFVRRFERIFGAHG